VDGAGATEIGIGVAWTGAGVGGFWALALARRIALLAARSCSLPCKSVLNPHWTTDGMNIAAG